MDGVNTLTESGQEGGFASEPAAADPSRVAKARNRPLFLISNSIMLGRRLFEM